MTPKQRLNHGATFPFDASDAWWNSTAGAPPEAKDWAVAAARGVIADLSDRHTIKRGFDNIDQATRREIVATLAAIIRVAQKDAQP